MASQRKDSPQTTGSHSFLVVDDDPAVGEVLTRLLVSFIGYEAKAVNSGEAAIDLLAERDFDVIFLDINMPMLNGKDLFKILESMDETLPGRVIFCTGQAVDPGTMPFIEKYKNLFLLKPFNRADLELILQKFFNRK